MSENILIIGANRGIGLALVKEILKTLKPAKLFATYRNVDTSKELIQLAEANPTVLRVLQMEATDETKLPEVIKQVDAESNGNGLHILICNAGISENEPQTMELINKQVIMRHFEINAVAPLIIAKAFLPLLEKGCFVGKEMRTRKSTIVNISSQMGSFGDFDKTNKRATGDPYYTYRGSKAALNMFTKSMSKDLEGKNIITVAIHPGSVQSDLGFPEAPLTTAQSAEGLVQVIRNLNADDNGKFFQYDGEELPW